MALGSGSVPTHTVTHMAFRSVIWPVPDTWLPGTGQLLPVPAARHARGAAWRSRASFAARPPRRGRGHLVACAQVRAGLHQQRYRRGLVASRRRVQRPLAVLTRGRDGGAGRGKSEAPGGGRRWEARATRMHSERATAWRDSRAIAWRELPPARATAWSDSSRPFAAKPRYEARVSRSMRQLRAGPLLGCRSGVRGRKCCEKA